MALINDFQASDFVDFDSYSDTRLEYFSVETYAPKTSATIKDDVSKWGRISRVVLGAEKSVVQARDVGLERLFKRLAKKAFSEFGPSSDLSRLFASPSYLAIIGLGQQVVPLLLNDMRETRRPWFVALAAITRSDPTENTAAGNIRGMTDAWLAWGKRRKLL